MGDAFQAIPLIIQNILLSSYLQPVSTHDDSFTVSGLSQFTIINGKRAISQWKHNFCFCCFVNLLQSNGLTSYSVCLTDSLACLFVSCFFFFFFANQTIFFVYLFRTVAIVLYGICFIMFCIKNECIFDMSFSFEVYVTRKIHEI